MVFLNVLIQILVILISTIIFFLMYSWNKNAGRFVIDHLMTFSVGFYFYWIVPIIIGSTGVISDNINDFKFWNDYFNMISEERIVLFLIFSLFYYIAFFIGSFIGRGKIKRLDIDICKKIYKRKIYLYLLLFFYGILLLFFIDKFKDALFTGYSVIPWEKVDDKGSFVALTSLYLSLAFIYTTAKNTVCRNTGFINLFFIFYFIAAFFVLSMGGRLYFLSAVIMLLIYYSVYYNLTINKKMFFCIITIILISGIIGVYRGNTNDEEKFLTLVLVNIFSENLYNSFSLFGFLKDYGFEILSYPLPLLSSFIDILPRAFFSKERELLKVTIEEFGYNIHSPVGALNSFPSLMVNFGILGSLIFIFIMGFVLSKMKMSKNFVCRVSYIMISGFITFSFFRDSFQVSIVKNIFQYSLLIPFVLINTLIINFKKKKGEIYRYG